MGMEPMNSEEVLRRLVKDKKEWLNTTTSSDEVRWTVRGIDLGIKHIKDVRDERELKDTLRKPPINKWYAKDLYHAIRTALDCLSRCDRARAIKVLEEAKERATR